MGTSKIIIAGFGGQGVMLIGQILAYAAMLENKHVTWLPAYGPEMRGGTANCSIIISDKEISSPVISSASELIAMNYPSLQKFEKFLAPNGRLFINSSMINEVPERTDLEIFNVNTGEIALALGNDKVANLVILGAFNQVTKVVRKDSIMEALEKVFKDDKRSLIEVNAKAYAEGETLFK